MLDNIVNTCCILFGQRNWVNSEERPEAKVPGSHFHCSWHCHCWLGLNAVTQNMPHSSYPVLFIVSMAIGAVVGTALDLEARFKKSRV